MDPRFLRETGAAAQSPLEVVVAGDHAGKLASRLSLGSSMTDRSRERASNP